MVGGQPEADYTVLMGATTYSVMSGFAAEGEPGSEPLAGMSKVVFSTTLSGPLYWANTQLVARDPIQAVREMKENCLSRCAPSAAPLCAAPFCTPWSRGSVQGGCLSRITGSSGRERIHDGYPDVALDMLTSRTIDGRTQLLEYVPTVLAKLPRQDCDQPVKSTENACPPRIPHR